MADYLLLYHGGDQPSEEEGEAVMAAWTAWLGGLGDAVKDGGNPASGQYMSVAADGSAGAGSSDVTGYSVVTADSLDAATDMAKSCPHLQANGTITVVETFAVM